METRAREGPFDLILLDVMLPGRDGFSICRNLRASGLATAVVLLTALGQEANKIRGLDLGADAIYFHCGGLDLMPSIH